MPNIGGSITAIRDRGRIALGLVEAEIQRLQWLWQDTAARSPAETALDSLLPANTAASLDLFDRLQLEAVVSVCRQCATLSEAGRTLFQHSRTQRSVVNDADRLRKYLLKFGLTWESLSPAPRLGTGAVH